MIFPAHDESKIPPTLRRAVESLRARGFHRVTAYYRLIADDWRVRIDITTNAHIDYPLSDLDEPGATYEAWAAPIIEAAAPHLSAATD